MTLYIGDTELDPRKTLIDYKIKKDDIIT